MKGAKSKSGADSKIGVKGGRKTKKEKIVKDPNKPKRPSSAFFVFMEDFRKEFKAKNPNNKAVSAVGKAGGAKWKLMTDEEKAPFVAAAEKRKTQYEKDMTAYNNKEGGGAKAASEGEKSSEVEDDEGSEEEDDD